MPRQLTVEEQLKKIRKLACNKICPNCHEENKFGHSNVVSIFNFY